MSEGKNLHLGCQYTAKLTEVEQPGVTGDDRQEAEFRAGASGAISASAPAAGALARGLRSPCLRRLTATFFEQSVDSALVGRPIGFGPLLRAVRRPGHAVDTNWRALCRGPPSTMHLHCALASAFAARVVLRISNPSAPREPP